MAFEVFPARAAVHIRKERSCNTFVALALLQSASICAGSEDPPLVRFILKCAPLPSFPCASSPGKQASRWLEPATAQAWAALVVSHHLDGLLRAKACGFVAPRYRFWSSLRFNAGQTCELPKQLTGPTKRIPVTRFTPLEEFPSFVAVLHHCSPCLLAVTLHFTPGDTPRCVARPDACSEERGHAGTEALACPQLFGASTWQARLKFSEQPAFRRMPAE